MTDDTAALEAIQTAPQRKRAKEIDLTPVADPMVKVRITRRGADKISDGTHEPILGDAFYAEGEIIELPKSVAEAQAYTLDKEGNERGFVEILP